MSKKSTTTNTPGWSTPPTTQATTNLQNMVDQGGDGGATQIRNAYARAGHEMDRSYKNPLGAFTTADVRDKQMREHKQNMYQSMGMDLAEAAQNAMQNKFNRQATVAGLTQPQMYNATSVNKTSDPMGMIMGIGQMASNLGAAAIG